MYSKYGILLQFTRRTTCTNATPAVLSGARVSAAHCYVSAATGYVSTTACRVPATGYVSTTHCYVPTAAAHYNVPTAATCDVPAICDVPTTSDVSIAGIVGDTGLKSI